MRRAQRHLLWPGRAAHRAGEGAGRDDDRQQGPDVHRQRARDEAQDHGRRGVLGRRLERRGRRARALRRSGARRLQEGRRPGWPAGRRDSRRRHVGQSSLHGLAAGGHRPEGSAPAPALPSAGRGRRARHRADGRQRDRLRLRRRDQGRDHRGHPLEGRQHARAAEGAHARQHRLRQLHGPLPGNPQGGRTRVRGRHEEGDVRLHPLHAGQPAHHPAQPAAEVGAGGPGDLRQRHRLRGLQAGAQLHARHALVRRSRRRPLGALHQRSRAREHPEGRHVLGRAAHPRRRHQPRRAAPHRRRRGQVPRCRW